MTWTYLITVVHIMSGILRLHGNAFKLLLYSQGSPAQYIKNFVFMVSRKNLSNKKASRTVQMETFACNIYDLCYANLLLL